jgi:hypothetical protein
MNNLKKIILAGLISVAMVGAGIQVANAQVNSAVGGQSLWKMVSGALQPMVSSWTIGSSASRVAKVWATDIDTTSLTFAGISGNLDMGGFNINNIGKLFTGNASSTLFSNFGTAYFGGTSTSTFSSTGALTLSSALGIASGGTNNTSYLTPAGGFNGLVYYDGTKLSTNSDLEDLSYNSSTHVVQTNKLQIQSAQTTVATFTNSTQSQSSTGGAGMIGYANPGTAMTAGSRLGFYLFGGAINTASTTANASGIAGFADETWSASQNGSSVQIYTTPRGSTTRVTHTTFASNGNVGVATTTPAWGIQIASSTAPQFALTDPSAAANKKHWVMRSVGGDLYMATSTDAYATSTQPSALELTKEGMAIFNGTAHGGSCTLVDGATITVDWNCGNTQEVVLAGTGRTLAFSNVSKGTAMKIWVWQDATGSRTITTYPTGTHWQGGSAPTLTTTAGKFDILVFTTSTSTTQYSGQAGTNY